MKNKELVLTGIMCHFERTNFTLIICYVIGATNEVVFLRTRLM